MPGAGIGRSSGAGTDITVGGRGHFEVGMLARTEKSIKCGEDLETLTALTKVSMAFSPL